MSQTKPSVVIVGGGFAGVGCAKELAKHDIRVTLIDRNNYHQFQPLLYQVATAELATTDVARPLRGIFKKDADRRRHAGRGDRRRSRDPDRSPPPTARPSPATTWCWRPARNRTSSARPGAERARLPALHGATTPARCARGCFEVLEDADADPALHRRGGAQLRDRRRRPDRRRDGGRAGRRWSTT